jgi:hypothetical protein
MEGGGGVGMEPDPSIAEKHGFSVPFLIQYFAVKSFTNEKKSHDDKVFACSWCLKKFVTV